MESSANVKKEPISKKTLAREETCFLFSGAENDSFSFREFHEIYTDGYCGLLSFGVNPAAKDSFRLLSTTHNRIAGILLFRLEVINSHADPNCNLCLIADEYEFSLALKQYSGFPQEQNSEDNVCFSCMGIICLRFHYFRKISFQCKRKWIFLKLGTESLQRLNVSAVMLLGNLI